jgi:hypothetical protein
LGALVTITGTNFGTTQGTSTVKFNGTPVTTITSWGATSITANVPTGATTGNVVVHASGVDSNGSAFTVVPAPSITSLSPTSGAVGTSVTITGTNFGTTQGTVAFNGTAGASTSWSSGSIVVPVPANATSGNVVVTANGALSNGVNFTVTAPPTLTSVAVTPANASVAAGNTQAFTATGTYSDNSTQDLTATAAWTSSAPTVAAIGNGGLASAIDNGQAVIQAVFSGISGTATLTVTPGQLDAIVTLVYTPIGGSEAYPNQKTIAVASDGFSRFITGDSSSSGITDQIVYVHCLDQDCAMSNTAKFTTGDYTLDFSMALGPDGFARIAYSTFSSIPPGHDSFLGFIQCSDADCTSFTNTVVDGASDNGVASIAVGNDGTSYIVYDYGYDRYDGVSLYDEQGVGLATCSSGTCGTTQIAPIDVCDSISAAITIGADGNPAIVYEDSGNTGTGCLEPQSVHYYANGTDTTISSDGSGIDDVAIGPDGFARVTFLNASGNGADFIQCTNPSCTANSMSAIVFSGNYAGAVSVMVGADGNAIVAGGSRTNPASFYVDYFLCTTANC